MSDERRKQIEKQAYDCAIDDGEGNIGWEGFVKGALWADANPVLKVETDRCQHGVLSTDRCFECDPNIGQTNVNVPNITPRKP